MTKAVLLILLYISIIMAPAMYVTFAGGDTELFYAELGKNFALMAFAVIFLQFVIGARIKWLVQPFGLDIVIRFHQYMAVFAAALLLAHPVLLAFGGKGFHLLTGLDLPWYIWLGKITLVLFILNIALSKFRRFFGISFERWRLLHDILALSIVVMALFHSFFAGDDLKLMFLKVCWFLSLGLVSLLFCYHKAIRPGLLKSRSYTVMDVVRECSDVWTVKLVPTQGGPVFHYLPGQFQFITFYRHEKLPVEEHHWTISSSPTEKGYISSTIKSLGDFTATMGKTRKGDAAAVHGPFGRFSHLLHPEEKDLVFIAGGIGITPLMSMLRYMHAAGDHRKVVLFYASRTPANIVFRREIDDIASSMPTLKVVHVLSQGDKNWQGETGHVDSEKITKYCGRDLAGKVFYICGPPAMLTSVVAALTEMGVKDGRIRTEIFSLVD